MRVGVRHASLEHAPYQLLVGHYQGLPLSGAEAQLNRRSEGSLERLLLTQQYPQQLGDFAILDPVDERRRSGAIIVGLGPTGELAPLQLRGVVARTLLRVGAQRARSPARGRRSGAPRRGTLGVSSVVVGRRRAPGCRSRPPCGPSSTGRSPPTPDSTRLDVFLRRRRSRRPTSCRSGPSSSSSATRTASTSSSRCWRRWSTARAGGPGQAVRQHVTYVSTPGAGRGPFDGDVADRRGERELAAGRHRGAAGDAPPGVSRAAVHVVRHARPAPVAGVTAERAVLDPLLAAAVWPPG